MTKLFRNSARSDGALGKPGDMRVLRVLRLIEHLAAAQHPQTLSQLSHRTGIPKATMMRTLEGLAQLGYVLRLPIDRGYLLGPAAADLALSTLKNNALMRGCRAILVDLVAAIGETCNLTIPAGSKVLYVDRVDTPEPLRLHLPVGTLAPMHCTASGKLFMSRLPLIDQRKMLSMMVLNPLTLKTIVDVDLLAVELTRLDVRGIGIDNEEFIHGMVAIAVPVCAPDGRTIAAVACHALTARQSLDQLMEYIPNLKVAALKLQPLLVG
ncbi:IclR family transcriptional regulator [Glaciimonas immobilis]|uniref:DNA-binding IclR family transcriptional regulator n=1 Tax=Glaciimonas immobilis TaxID=728004 RepID=A0A840RJE9_9BURK|nr:IclR family transcriptional regulator [Glaciimonas immobilis]KAF3998913.1 IclR family transcriptional regulator [Glaciimonas immobilis]MBB5198317.1 DNA-binding IclR family transcriptional regulator [Glaciimonas immobilis]